MMMCVFESAIDIFQDILSLPHIKTSDGKHSRHVPRVHTEEPTRGRVHEGHQTRGQETVPLNCKAPACAGEYLVTVKQRSYVHYHAENKELSSDWPVQFS